MIKKSPKPKPCAWSKCGKMFTPNPFRFNQRTCDNIMCAMGHVKEKADENEAKEWNKKKKVIKEKLKTLGDYEKEAKREFQHWVRLRDANHPCISCGKTSSRYDGGHYFDAGTYSGLIFHPWNVNKQCSYNCNKMLHGNKANYRIGLVAKIGEENVKWLEENKDRLRDYKFTKDEFIEIKLKYKAKIKEINNP